MKLAIIFAAAVTLAMSVSAAPLTDDRLIIKRFNAEEGGVGYFSPHDDGANSDVLENLSKRYLEPPTSDKLKRICWPTCDDSPTTIKRATDEDLEGDGVGYLAPHDAGLTASKRQAEWFTKRAIPCFWGCETPGKREAHWHFDATDNVRETLIEPPSDNTEAPELNSGAPQEN